MPSTLTKIFSDLRRFRTSKNKKRDPKYYDDVVIRFIEVRVFPRNKQIIYRTQVDSVTKDGKSRYDTHLMFSNIKLYDAQQRGTVPIQDAKTKQLYYTNPVRFSTSVQLKCTCPDFRHTWETELKRGGALIGFPRKYRRKTTWWPERNPKHVMGMCKHVYSVIRQLGTIGVLRP